jgi:hypothetical protein
MVITFFFLSYHFCAKLRRSGKKYYTLEYDVPAVYKARGDFSYL